MSRFIIDTFEQPVQRPQKRQKRFYSGKKKRHTLKSQVAVDEETGRSWTWPRACRGRPRTSRF